MRGEKQRGAGRADAVTLNLAHEFERNDERYRFVKWAQSSLGNLRVFPPGTGIIHQVNLEHVASVVVSDDTPDGPLLYPDFVIGGDSHTPMVNGLGVLGWGVGGIDAEAMLLGYPTTISGCPTTWSGSATIPTAPAGSPGSESPTRRA